MLERTGGWMELGVWDPGEVPRQDFLEETQNTCRERLGSVYDAKWDCRIAQTYRL